MEKPPAVFPDPRSVPDELRSLKRWIGFRFDWDGSKQKWKKPPHSPVTGERIGATQKHAAHFLDFDGASAGAAARSLDGLGLVLLAEDGLVGGDFDDCRNGGALHPEVAAWLRWFPTYAEVSPSGSGVHFIGRGRLPKALTSTELPNAGGAKVELYSDSRYLTFTADALGGERGIADVQAGLDKLLAALGAADPRPGADDPRPMTRLTARKIHADNLDALRRSPQGRGNEALNAAAFFAARALAALEQDEDEVKAELLRIVTEEWDSPHPETGARATVESGWRSGAERPLDVIDDEFPEAAQAVEELNRRFFVTENLGGKCRVCWKEPDPAFDGQTFLQHQSFNDFRNRFMHQRVQTAVKESGEARWESRAEVWLNSRHRRQYEKVAYLPGQTAPEGVLNLWEGFAVEPRKGDCSLYLRHLSENVCGSNQSAYGWLLSWMAYSVRNPGENGHVAVVVQGQKGVGKNVFAEAFASLWGGHSILLSSERRATSNFNAHLRDKSVLISDEAFFAGDPRQDRVIKDLITGRNIAIEAKGVDLVVVPNLLHIIILGNDDRLVRATQDERRYFSLKCAPKWKGKPELFAALLKQLRDGGRAALLHHLLEEVKLEGFNPHEAPHTDALRAQMADTLEGIESVWFECLSRGELPGMVRDVDKDWIRASDLVAWASKQGRRDWTGISAEKVANLLGDNPKTTRKGMGFKKGRFTLRSFDHEERYHGWVVPNLAQARSTWTERRFKWEWDENDEWKTVPST